MTRIPPHITQILARARDLTHAGDASAAELLLRRALQKERDDPYLLETLAQVLFERGQKEQALYFSEQAVRRLPNHAMVRHNYGSRLFASGRAGDAIEHLREAARLQPSSRQTWATLLHALFTESRLSEGIALGEELVRKDPAWSEPHMAMGSFLVQVGRAQEGLDHLSRAIELGAPKVEAQFLRMLSMCYSDQITPDELLRAHREMGDLVLLRTLPDPLPHPNIADPDRRLRVGFVSQDFRNRSAAHFIEPVITRHDRASFEVFLYSNTGSRGDEMTLRLRDASDHWVDITDLEDKEAEQRIRADGIDVMVDLTGWTGGNRLRALAGRPAPVQCTYMGYPSTTGLRAIEYRIVDALTDPPGRGDELATERLVRISPCFLCYAPPRHAPPVSPCPSDSGAPLTFGSFNTQAKLTPSTLDTWTRVLQRVPGSRLVLKNRVLGDAGIAAWTLDQFTRRGVEASRLECLGETTSLADHMGLYRRVDVALDPFPYNGTTTTMEAMWMGVPVVVLEGASHHSRVGVSLMSAIGHPELVARDREGYIELAANLAGDADRRRELRRTLRDRIGASPLCDGDAFTRKFEAALRQMWRTWCEQRPKT